MTFSKLKVDSLLLFTANDSDVELLYCIYLFNNNNNLIVCLMFLQHIVFNCCLCSWYIYIYMFSFQQNYLEF